GASADNDAVAALVEDLGDCGVQLPAVSGAVEADADIAGRQVRAVTRYPPGRSAALVVQRGVQVPCAGRLILQRAGRIAASPYAFPRFAAHDLQRAGKAESLGFEQFQEVSCLWGGHISGASGC